MAFKYTCDNIDSDELVSELKKIPLRKRKKILFKDCTVAIEKRLKKKLSPFTPPLREEKANVKDVLHLLNKCFTINKNVKQKAYYTYDNVCEECGGYGDHDNISCHRCYGYSTWTEVDYNLRDSEYSRKTAFIKTAIGLIRYNNLPIDYWKNDGVVYFEYHGKQVSFHDPKDQIICRFKNKQWSGIINKKIPFII